MWEQMYSFLKSWFIYQDAGAKIVLVSIVLALAFAAIWLLLHWPPLFRRHWLWAVAVFSAFFTMLAITFVQIPLQHYTGVALTHFWSVATLNDWILLTGLPQILLSGLVQEGAKMVPMVAWWWRSGRHIDPKLGLAIGAIAGAGYGIFEGFWVHTNVLGNGWTLQPDRNLWLHARSTPFWERFFAIGFHIACSSLVGYGLAKGNGWQFYLIAAGLHGSYELCDRCYTRRDILPLIRWKYG